MLQNLRRDLHRRRKTINLVKFDKQRNETPYRRLIRQVISEVKVEFPEEIQTQNSNHQYVE